MYIQHEIKFSKKKNIFNLCISFVFFAGSYWLYNTNDSLELHGFDVTDYHKYIGIVGMVLFGFGGYFFLKNLFFKKTFAFVITKDRLIDNTISFKAGKEFWLKDIDRFEERILSTSHFNKQKFVAIFLKDHTCSNDFLARNKISKMTYDYNIKNYGTPFLVSTDLLECTHKDFFELLETILIKYNKL